MGIFQFYKLFFFFLIFFIKWPTSYVIQKFWTPLFYKVHNNRKINLWYVFQEHQKKVNNCTNWKSLMKTCRFLGVVETESDFSFPLKPPTMPIPKSLKVIVRSFKVACPEIGAQFHHNDTLCIRLNDATLSDAGVVVVGSLWPFSAHH